MSSLKTETQEVSVVVVGNLNPAIFNPDWLIRQELLRADDAKDVTIDIIHPELARFSLAWCQLEVQPNRLVLRTEKKGYVNVIRDLAIGILSVLHETPITAIGLNSRYTIFGDQREELDNLGDKLAPKDPWISIFPAGTKHGLSFLNMQTKRNDEIPGHYATHVKYVTKSDKDGLELLVNCHFVVDEEANADAVNIIQTHWDDSLRMASSVQHGILRLAGEG